MKNSQAVIIAVAIVVAAVVVSFNQGGRYASLATQNDAAVLDTKTGDLFFLDKDTYRMTKNGLEEDKYAKLPPPGFTDDKKSSNK